MKKSSMVIYGQLPNSWGPGGAIDLVRWSGRQLDFFTKNRDSVLSWVREDVRSMHVFGVNYKELLVNLNAVEMIPDLLAFFDRERVSGILDNDIYTVLMLLMNLARYPPWQETGLYQRLYVDAFSSYSYVNWSIDDELLIRRMATKYYQSTLTRSR